MRWSFRWLGTISAGLTISTAGWAQARDTATDREMEALPIALPELTVVAAEAACPNGEEARARDLWQTVRRQYATTTAARGMYIRSRVGEERLVPAERVGWIEEKHLRGRVHRRVGALEEPSLDRFLDVNTRIRADGYAIPRERNETSWQFVNLSGMNAHHFASDVFGERHTLSILDEDVHGVVIAFCPVRTDQPSIEGTLVVSRDSAFVSAKWRYRTPRQRQDAGGEVTFLPHWSRREAPPHLLAGRGVFWQQDPTWMDRYFHRVQVFTEWVISDTGEVPDTIGAW